MRYIQMIKRCKIPLKKATSDMEAHGEEQAKRCTMSTADLKTAVPSWEDRLGHLRHSAVARLLIEGKLPVESSTSSSLGDCGSAMDLSKSSVLDKARNFHRDDYRMKPESVDLTDATADRVRHQMGVEMEALKTRSSSNEVRFGGWKCRYCPYNTNTSKKLYSHYQFHQQLLTSQSAKPHMEWLTAYRQAKEFSDGNSTPITSSLNMTSTNVTSPQREDPYVSNNGAGRNSPAPMFLPGCFPPSLDDPGRLQAMRANGLSLRYLLGGKGHLSKQTPEEQNSASGCLRSIVQAVMKQGTRTSQASMTTTSVYASLVNSSSSGSSPKINQRESPCPASGPMVAPMTHLPNNQTVISTDAHVKTVSGNGQVAIDTDSTRIMRPEPRRRDVLDLEMHNHLTLSNGHVDPMTPHQESEAYKRTNTDCPPPGKTVHNSPPRQTVTIECQVPLSVPERPASRDSTSSFTSSASSEINVDDSPMPYSTRRRGSLITERSHSDIGSVRIPSRKRSHSIDSDLSSRGILLQHPPTGSGDLHDLPCRTEELEMDLASKILRLDYVYDSRIKEERAITPETGKYGNASPIAVISSTGTPPPTTQIVCREEQESLGEEDMHNLRKSTNVKTKETSIQCELLVPPSGDGWTNPQLLGPEAFTNVPDQSTNQDGSYPQRPTGTPIVIGSVKCPHCGIMFDDSVLHSIHMGCHSHSDPFICNVCGEQCSNKYGFYTHIMRGHHKH